MDEGASGIGSTPRRNTTAISLSVFTEHWNLAMMMFTIITMHMNFTLKYICCCD
jgi:hypothetical protein